MIKKLFTIGVYGWTEQTFFDALVHARVSALWDVRARRGVRGAQYAFANDKRLEARLDSLGIEYRHLKALAPPMPLRTAQVSADARAHTGQRHRIHLTADFTAGYLEHLKSVEAVEVLTHLPADTHPALMCVERGPEACHRGLLAEWIVTHTSPSPPLQHLLS